MSAINKDLFSFYLENKSNFFNEKNIKNIDKNADKCADIVDAENADKRADIVDAKNVDKITKLEKDPLQCCGEIIIYEGNYTCNGCGQHLCQIIDEEYDSMIFDNDEKSTRRCEAINSYLLESSYGTDIQYSNKNYKHFKQLRSMNTWHVGSYKDKLKRNGFTRLSKTGTKYGINQNIIEYGHYLYNLFEDERGKYSELKNSSRGDPKDGQVAACLFKACEVNNAVRTKVEISQMFGIDQKDVNSGINMIEQVLKDELSKKNMDYENMDPTVYIPRYCNILNISDEHRDKIIKICEVIGKMEILQTNIPQSIACGCIFYISYIFNLGISKKTICERCKTSLPTITKVYKKLDAYNRELIKYI